MDLAPLAYVVTRFPKTTETFIYREISELRQRGHTVHLLAQHRDEGILQPEVANLAEAVQYPRRGAGLLADVAVMTSRQPATLLRAFARTVWGNRTSPSFLVKGLLSVAQGASLVRRMDLEIQLAHAHFATHSAVCAMTIGMLRDIPWSTTVHAHDLYANTSMLKEKMADAAGVVTISAFNQRLLRNEFDRTDTELIRCGVDMELFPFRTPKPATEPWQILSVGRLNSLKGHDTLLRACAVLAARGRAFKCTIVGEGPLHGELTQLARELGIADAVDLVGALPREGVLDLLSHADCFALACDIESDGTMDGIPNVLIEAMACGVPVVTTDVSGIGELVRNHETGVLVGRREPEAMAEGIETVCTDHDTRRELADRARAEVEQHFDIAQSVTQLEMFFSQLTTRP